jgi:hypothetical protein
MTMTRTTEAPARTATPETLEQRFGVSSATWRRWVGQGRLAGYRLSRRRMVIDLDEAEELVRRSRIGPAQLEQEEIGTERRENQQDSETRLPC